MEDAPASTEHGALPGASQIIAELLAAVQATPWQIDRIAGDVRLQQLVVEAFIEAELARLFEERNRRMMLSEEPSTYEPAQAALKAQEAVRAALEVARDVLGPFELLTDDPRAQANGALATWEQEALVELTEDEQRAAMSTALGYPAPGAPPPLR